MRRPTKRPPKVHAKGMNRVGSMRGKWAGKILHTVETDPLRHFAYAVPMQAVPTPRTQACAATLSWRAAAASILGTRCAGEAGIRKPAGACGFVDDSMNALPLHHNRASAKLFEKPIRYNVGAASAKPWTPSPPRCIFSTSYSLSLVTFVRSGSSRVRHSRARYNVYER